MINPFQPNIIDDPVLSGTSIYLYRKKKRIARKAQDERFALLRFSTAVPEAQAGGMTRDT
jgi:hypothetical protein